MACNCSHLNMAMSRKVVKILLHWVYFASDLNSKEDGKKKSCAVVSDRSPVKSEGLVMGRKDQ